jgi:hypothetical protein
MTGNTESSRVAALGQAGVKADLRLQTVKPPPGQGGRQTRTAATSACCLQHAANYARFPHRTWP